MEVRIRDGISSVVYVCGCTQDLVTGKNFCENPDHKLWTCGCHSVGGYLERCSWHDWNHTLLMTATAICSALIGIFLAHTLFNFLPKLPN